jgi:hypothetical protein
VAAATWPLGLWMSIGSVTREQARKTNFSTSIAPNVAHTTPSQIIAPRRQPCSASTMAIARATGSITA